MDLSNIREKIDRIDDEIVRLFVMNPYMKKGKWIKPMTEQGRANLEEFRRVMEQS